jgi:tRNA nucleotidyltransferase (CCA-adding enzyme)
VAVNRTALQVAALLPNKPKVQVFKKLRYGYACYEDTEIEFVGARKESYHLKVEIL